MSDTTGLKNLVEFMAKSLVDDPTKLEVKEVQGDQTTLYQILVDKDERGKVIGKKGKTVGAMRTILSAASAKIRRRTHLEVPE